MYNVGAQITKRGNDSLDDPLKAFFAPQNTQI
jgi:hypothetical protein